MIQRKHDGIRFVFGFMILNKMNDWNLMLLSSSEFERRKMTVKLSNEHVQ